MPPRPAPSLLPTHARTDAGALHAFDVRPVEERDLPSLVAVHLQQFPDGFYVRLGASFMTRYFRRYFNSPGAVWRAGSLLAVTAAVVVASRTRIAPPPPPSPATRDGGRLLHRALFGCLSLLPQGLRDSGRRKVFDAMFALSDDPWGYDEVAYEHRKRGHLLDAISSEARTVVEVGCADGHNLVALARRRPDVTIIGTDVSSAAVAIATRRTRPYPNVEVVRSDDCGSLRAAVETHIDCVILSEVLYYLGSERTVRDALQPVHQLMSPDCRVVLLHGSADAAVLHQRAMQALELHALDHRRVDDPERPFVVTIAARHSHLP